MTHTRTRRSPRTTALTSALAVAALSGVLGLAGCSAHPSGGSGSQSDSSVSGGSSGSAASSAVGAAAVADSVRATDDVAPQHASVISTGDVALRSRDVGRTVDGVRHAVAGDGGSVQRESTDTDDDGTAISSRLTVRVPTSRFTAVMAELGRAGTLISTSSNTRDVTTIVLDNQVRVQVAQHSIDRISALLDQATSIRDVISIESELAQRQADLGSLESQQKYLADQTSMATITVSVEQSSTTAPPPDDATGFAAGLAAGWHALSRSARALATAGGALLPWLLVLALLGVPTRILVRRRRRLAA